MTRKLAAIGVALFLALIGAMPAQAASSYTPCYAFENPTPGDPAVANQWGTIENTGRTLTDTALGGTLTLSVAGASNVVLTAVNGGADQSRSAHYVFTGTITGNVDVLWPASPRCGMFSVTNSTSGAFALAAGVNNGSSSPAGTTVTIPAGQTLLVVSDGTNVVSALTGGGIGALLAANNLSDLPNVATARTNLGLGTAAVANTGSSGHALPFMDIVNTFSASQVTVGSGAIGWSATTTSAGGTAAFEAANDVGNVNELVQFGSTTAGTNFGLPNANLGLLLASNKLAIGTAASTGGNFAMGTLGTEQLLLTAGGGVTAGSPTGGDKGTDTFNVQFIYEGGNRIDSTFLQVAHNLSDLSSASTARTNLGLVGGSCSTHQFVNAIASTAAPTCAQPSTSDVSGLGAISTHGFAASGQVSLPGAGSSISPVAHSPQSGTPTALWAVLICTTSNLGYSVGDIVPVPATNDTTTDRGLAVSADATNFNATEGSGGISLINKSTGQAQILNDADWKVLISGLW